MAYTGKTARKIKTIKRLIWASLDFAAARDLAQLVVERPDDRSNSWATRAIETGIIISYARPFGDNVGLGTLPDKFRKFDGDPGAQIMHDGILRSRDIMEAHTNLLERHSIMGNQQDDVTAIEITVNARGSISWSVMPPHLPEEYFGYFVQLIELQLARVEQEILALGDGLVAEFHRKPGLYHLGVDFP